MKDSQIGSVLHELSPGWEENPCEHQMLVGVCSSRVSDIILHYAEEGRTCMGVRVFDVLVKYTFHGLLSGRCVMMALSGPRSSPNIHLTRLPSKQ